MLRIIDCSAQEFYKKTENDRIIIFGAGLFGEYCIEAMDIADRIYAVVDNNTKKQGTILNICNHKYTIIGSDELCLKLKKDKSDAISVLISTSQGLSDIVAQLDEIEQLNNTKCFFSPILRNRFNYEDKFSFFKGTNIIPKKIHYFWVGGGKIPNEYEEYMKTWKHYCPEYEIIRWDETNYDFSKNSYMRQAYENKAWGYVPDYARLDVIYKEGGFYLDTDVELVQSLNSISSCKAVFPFGDNFQINIGAGFGAVKRCEIIKEMRDFYNDKYFVNKDGSLNNKKTTTWYQNPVFKKYGFNPFNNKYQEKDGIVIYPNRVMSPLGTGNMGINEDAVRDEYTIAIHYNASTWKGKDRIETERQQYELLKNRMC